MHTTRSIATRKTGLAAWSVAALVTVLAAVSACSASGDTVDQQQPQPTSQVERQVDEPGEYESEYDESEPGENENEADESELGENENEADESEAGENENEADESEPDEYEDEGGGNEV